MSFNWTTYRENLVSDRIKFLMSEGQEYYPFEFQNFAEALQNLDDANMQRLNRAARVAAYPSIVEYSKYAGACLLDVVSEYWRAIATNSAERQIKSAEELEFDARRTARFA